MTTILFLLTLFENTGNFRLKFNKKSANEVHFSNRKDADIENRSIFTTPNVED